MTEAMANRPANSHDLRVVWGYNNWVDVSNKNASQQDQITSPAELEEMIRRLGVPEDEAHGLASEFWRQRPSDASALMAQARQSMFAATGLPARTVLITVAVFVALYIFVGTYR